MFLCPRREAFMKATTREAEETTKQKVYKEVTLLWTRRKCSAEWSMSEKRRCHKENTSKNDGNADGKHFGDVLLSKVSGV